MATTMSIMMPVDLRPNLPSTLEGAFRYEANRVAQWADPLALVVPAAPEDRMGSMLVAALAVILIEGADSTPTALPTRNEWTVARGADRKVIACSRFEVHHSNPPRQTGARACRTS